MDRKTNGGGHRMVEVNKYQIFEQIFILYFHNGQNKITNGDVISEIKVIP